MATRRADLVGCGDSAGGWRTVRAAAAIPTASGAAVFAARIDAYDRRRAAIHRYANERDPARWGKAAFYGWSEDKARQYGVPQRTDFGAFVRAKGFCLD